MTTKIYGASDDLIEIEGDITEEFYILGTEDENYLAFSDGSVLKISFENPGIWRIVPVVQMNTWEITQAPEDDRDNYSDVAVSDVPIVWVVHGGGIAKKK